MTGTKAKTTQRRTARPKTVPPTSHASNVAAPAAPIVGRVEELATLGARLAHGDRLVTVVGPPGTGKTRLVQELGVRVLAGKSELARPRGGVVWVDLSVAATADDVTRAAAAALDVEIAPSEAGAIAARRLGHALASRGGTLVLLDNFEQVAAHAPLTLALWMALAPRASFVTTSRELLRIDGESALEIAPLPVPAEGATGGDEIRGAPAVQLLLARASGWTPRDDELSLVGELVRRLEGLPLAVELAASRLRVLGVRELYAELARPLDLLGHGRRDAAPRQVTLRAALESSWSLLDAGERQAMARLGLFRGSFDARAAAALVDDVAAADGRLALDLVQSLRDKSLVARADETRLRLFESVRAFALEKLEESGRGAEAARRLGGWLAAEAELRVAELPGRAQRDAFAWLVRERDNLLAAEQALVERDPSHEATQLRARLLLAVDPVLARHGPSGAHRERLDAVVVAAETEALAAPLRARLLAARGRAARDAGDAARAVADVSRATELDEGSPALFAELGMTLLAQGRFDDARRALDRAHARAVALGERHAEQRALALLGLASHGKGALADAHRFYVQALDLASALGDARAEAEVRKDLGSLCLQRGALDEARAYYEQALAGDRGADRRVEGVVLGNLGILAQERGDLDGALELCRRGIATMRALGDRPFEGHLVGYLAGVHWERGDLDEARVHYETALAMLREAGDVRLEGLFLAATGGLDAARGDGGRAANAFEESERKLNGVGDPGLLAALDAHRGQLDVLRSRAARDASDAPEEARLDQSARARLARTEPHAAASDDVRFARRLLARSMAADRFVVGKDGSWFRCPGSESVDLSGRATLARLIDLLARARLDTPGRPVTHDEILAASWPGEKVLARAATNRVKVAVSTLRGLGWRGTLVHREDGYLIAAHVPVARGDNP